MSQLTPFIAWHYSGRLYCVGRVLSYTWAFTLMNKLLRIIVNIRLVHILQFNDMYYSLPVICQSWSNQLTWPCWIQPYPMAHIFSSIQAKIHFLYKFSVLLYWEVINLMVLHYFSIIILYLYNHSIVNKSSIL